jgi:hypothetical protein
MIALITGYIASLLLAISLIVNNELKFRWLNTLGCLSFIVYGIFINALPVILTNSILLLINIFYLFKIYSAKEDFELLDVTPGNQFIGKFIAFYKKDILDYFPEFTMEQLNTQLSFVVLRDIVVANIFAAHIEEDGNAIVNINYTVPKYRDYKIGMFLFDKEKKYLLSKGVKQIIYKEVHNKNHQAFLKKMGFKKESYQNAPCFIKHL